MPQPMPTFDSLDAWPGEAARPPLRMLEPRLPVRRPEPTSPAPRVITTTPAARAAAQPASWLQRVRGALIGG